MKILVTGGAGYKGSLLIPKLLEHGNQVILYDNFMFGTRPILHFATNENIEIIKGDVRDEDKIKEVLKTPDVVIHLAAIVGYPACAADPARAFSINVGGSRNIVKNMSKNQKVIFASTGSTYGKVDGICDENTPIAPLTLYGSNKAEAEKMFIDIGGVALRFATVFGISPRLRLDLLINDFVYQAIHNKQIVLFEGSFRRTFLHVLDAVNSYIFTLENMEEMQGKSYNVGDDSMNYTKKDIALIIKEKLPYYLHEAEIGEDFDQRDYEVSYKKINKIGYKSDITMNEGIDELIKVLRNIHIINEWRNA
jgi:nucleoside-diphosphate-sugar epimerase